MKKKIMSVEIFEDALERARTKMKDMAAIMDSAKSLHVSDFPEITSKCLKTLIDDVYADLSKSLELSSKAANENEMTHKKSRQE